ncbi:hypothetical protein B0H13DRAFT_2305635 [Mycena leptocephala]|nr:hypothetical protein B0H13DRAFT_2305635 [Mycena leptocephala]
MSFPPSSKQWWLDDVSALEWTQSKPSYSFLDPDADPEDEALGGSSSPSLGRTNNPRKRPAEDMVRYAESTARHLRLKMESTQSLKEYSQLLALEQSIWLAGHLLAQNEVLSTLQAPEAVYHMPLTLEGAIDEYAFLVLLDPTASTYVAQGKTGPLHHNPHSRVIFLNSPLRALHRPSWEISHKSKKAAVVERMRNVLTRVRNAIEDLASPTVTLCPTADDSPQLVASLGNTEAEPDDNSAQPMDIVTLCQRAIARGAKYDTELKVSLEMCGRFAFLRETYVTITANAAKGATNPNTADPARPTAPSRKKEADFWSTVDKDLAELREKKKNDPARISNTISAILADDKKLYPGDTNLEEPIQCLMTREDEMPEADDGEKEMDLLKPPTSQEGEGEAVDKDARTFF